MSEQKTILSANRRRVLQLMAISVPSAAYLANVTEAMAQTRSEGYGQDVDVNNPVVTWDKTLNGNILKNLDIIGDLIIPADEKSPSASHLNITDFVNEWLSAPYPDQRADKMTILEGLSKLDAYANKQDKRYYHELDKSTQARLFDNIASAVEAGMASEQDEKFFERLVYIYVGGFYTTDEGMADIGYVGNVPLETFDGPPAEVRKILGL